MVTAMFMVDIILVPEFLVRGKMTLLCFAAAAVPEKECRCCSAARFDGDYTADEPSGNVWRAWLGYYHMDHSSSVFHCPGGRQPAGLCSLWNPSAEEEKNRPATR